MNIIVYCLVDRRSNAHNFVYVFSCSKNSEIDPCQFTYTDALDSHMFPDSDRRAFRMTRQVVVRLFSFPNLSF